VADENGANRGPQKGSRKRTTSPGKSQNRSSDEGKASSGSGILERLFRPWKGKRQQITLTRPGAKLAPLRRGKPGGAKGKTSAQDTPPGPLPPKNRAIKELKTLLAIGKKDPERLAGIISKMLREDEEKDNEARLKFERLIWEKAEGKGSSDRKEDAE